MTRKIFLHIGCGKTGSSALQVWLNHIHDELKQQGVDYPLFNQHKLADYQISSGNGGRLIHAIREGEIEGFLSQFLNNSQEHLLFSSESFQTLTSDEIDKLVFQVEKVGLELVIIAYIRNAYDYAYASWLQGVKRHLFTDSFKESALRLTNLQQFSAIDRFQSQVKQMIVLHYDTEKMIGLEKSFCRAIRINPDSVPAMNTAKVNRSLTFFETELMLFANQCFTKRFGNKNDIFSRKISDAFIYAQPELEADYYYDEVVIAHFETHLQSHVDRLNQLYFPDERLKLVERKDNNAQPVPKSLVPNEFKTMIETIIASVSHFESTPNLEPKRQRSKDIPVSDLIQALMEESRKREKLSIGDALEIMRVVKLFRPDGPMIKHRISELEQKLQGFSSVIS